MTDNIIELKNISKHFPGVVANDNITIDVRRGEVFALLGENGAGKSTLMSILFGLYEPDEGEICVRGQRVEISSPAHAAALSIGMVHQHFKLVEDFSVTENIILGIEPMRNLLGFFSYVDIKKAEEKVAAISREAGLDVDPKALIRDVGVSMRQRVEILKMLYREADILIFDEPTAMLAPQEIEYLLEILENLRRQGKTIILITHKLGEVVRIADRCAILNRGRLVGIYDVCDTPIKKMAAYMVGRELEEEQRPKEHEFGSEVLSVRDLYVSGQGAKQIRGVSFSIRAGEIFAVAGVDGNGQTQLADAIAGLLEAATGQILLAGEDIGALSIRRRMEAGLSYVPEDRQEVGLLLDFFLRQNLATRRYYRPPFSIRYVLREGEFDVFAGRLIANYDIRGALDGQVPMRSLSGGNQQKAIVAREIELGSRLMIFVQPTRGLDIGATRAIHQRILDERAAGRAILLVSMELDEVKLLADTIGVMFEGKMNRIAPAHELSIDEIGEYMMGVK